ncbi:atp-dependent rna helicase rhle-related [Holotrichia oblita]|nr:atp-dependent rna helicase rhle-related [Holotrichia oblita]
MNFDEFGLDKRITDAINLQGYISPTPIQQKAIPPAIIGRDVLGSAQTGTGKTCAFAAPILHRLGNAAENIPLLDTNGKKIKRPIRALILTPTRELALQIDESFRAYGKFMPLKTGIIMGGVDQGAQIKVLKAGVDILTATPGRFIDLVNQGCIDTSGIEIFVLDEADRMLDMGFFPDVKRIIAMLTSRSQTLFFSATMPPEVKKLTDALLTNPVRVAVAPVSSTVDLIDQWVCLTDRVSKLDLLIWVFKQIGEDASVLIFARTKHGADKLCDKLRRAGIHGRAIHGDKSQGARQDALSDFKSGKCRVLVATDIAARGLDIDDITHVINYELPSEAETYVHRIGRTGRAGKAGTAISFCDFDEEKLLKDIEKLIKKKIDIENSNPYPMTVFTKTIKQPRPPRPSRRQSDGQPSAQQGDKVNARRKS